MSAQQIHDERSLARRAAGDAVRAHMLKVGVAGASDGFGCGCPCVWWTEGDRLHRLVWMGLEPHTGDDRWVMDVEGCGYGSYPTMEDALEGARKMREERR